MCLEICVFVIFSPGSWCRWWVSGDHLEACFHKICSRSSSYSSLLGCIDSCCSSHSSKRWIDDTHYHKRWIDTTHYSHTRREVLDTLEKCIQTACDKRGSPMRECDFFCNKRQRRIDHKNHPKKWVDALTYTMSVDRKRATPLVRVDTSSHHCSKGVVCSRDRQRDLAYVCNELCGMQTLRNSRMCQVSCSTERNT